jgi:hypothetical protein
MVTFTYIDGNTGSRVVIRAAIHMVPGGFLPWSISSLVITAADDPDGRAALEGGGANDHVRYYPWSPP